MSGIKLKKEKRKKKALGTVSRNGGSGSSSSVGGGRRGRCPRRKLSHSGPAGRKKKKKIDDDERKERRNMPGKQSLHVSATVTASKTYKRPFTQQSSCLHLFGFVIFHPGLRRDGRAWVFFSLPFLIVAHLIGKLTNDVQIGRARHNVVDRT